MLTVIAGAALWLLCCLAPSSRGSDLLLHGVGGPIKIIPPATTAAFANTSSLAINGGLAQFLSQLDSSAGDFNRTNFQVSFWFYRTSLTNNSHGLVSQWGASGQRSWLTRLQDNDTLTFALTTNNSTSVGLLTTTNALATLSNWVHVFIQCRLAESIGTNKIKMWTNGFECTNLSNKAYPSNGVLGVFNSTNRVCIGTNTAEGASFWGYMDEIAMTSGSNSLTVSDFINIGTKTPKDLTGLPTLWLWNRGGDVTSIIHDQVLAQDWTNHNTVTQVSTAP